MSDKVTVLIDNREKLFEIIGNLPADSQPIIKELEALDGVTEAKAGYKDSWLAVSLEDGMPPLRASRVLPLIKGVFGAHDLIIKLVNPVKR